jgi:tetratricopeptide (TPR) repeat protein
LNVNIQESAAWKAAKWRYASIQAAMMVPFGETASPGEIIEELDEIANECPEFYPAVLESALRRMALGDDASAAEQIETGLRLMLDVGDPRHVEEEALNLHDNLENLWRFDLCQHCMEVLVQRFPEKALFRDYLANAAAQLGDVATALEHSAKAIAMEPENSHFRGNRGLHYLMAGNAKEAKLHLAAALRLDPENETHRSNLTIQEYLARHGGSFSDYLVRPLDKEEIERLSEDDDLEVLDRLCAEYNADRLQALGRQLAADPKSRGRCADMISTLRTFFDFVERVSAMAGLLYEDISHVHRNFQPIMHKFIFKFADVDQEMLDDVCDSLLEYYGFLARQQLVSSVEFERFQELVGQEREGLIAKIERYNAIRHDDEMDEEEKEAIREELFEGDHAWPHL